MDRSEKKDWVVLNNIIYKIHTTDNFDEMRICLLDQLRLIIDYDSADFFIASNMADKMICNPVKFNCDVDLSEMYEEERLSGKAAFRGKSSILRETDIMPEEERFQTDYYKNVYKPNNWHFALQIIIARNNKFLGIITFYRTIGKEDFDQNDLFMLDILKNHLEYRLEKYLSGIESTAEKLTISEASERFDLSKREETVLRELMLGKEGNVICDELFITTNTLKKHILNIYRKLGVKNRVQLFKMIKERE
ncbi:MAG: LuxR C-terminal-related transcriptional regulator [Lachnospiraceae bacterium]|nr:LuxR C-terminal-related transcriptional regulator [Lachnospiraceae bacterium]